MNKTYLTRLQVERLVSDTTVGMKISDRDLKDLLYTTAGLYDVVMALKWLWVITLVVALIFGLSVWPKL